jgi:hypothetical protein
MIYDILWTKTNFFLYNVVVTLALHWIRPFQKLKCVSNGVTWCRISPTICQMFETVCLGRVSLVNCRRWRRWCFRFQMSVKLLPLHLSHFCFQYWTLFRMSSCGMSSFSNKFDQTIQSISFSFFKLSFAKNKNKITKVAR